MLILECSQDVTEGRTDGRKEGRMEALLCPFATSLARGQNSLKDVDPRVFTRLLQKDGRTEGRKEGRTDSSVTISLRNFVGEGIIISCKRVLNVHEE